MEHLPHDPIPAPPEQSIAELLRVTLLLMKPYAMRSGNQAGLHELEKHMRNTIKALESADPKERSAQRCRAVLPFRRPLRHPGISL